MKKTNKKDEAYWMQVLQQAFNVNQWGHWCSLNGLCLVFNVKKQDRLEFRKAMKKIARATKNTVIIHSLGNTPYSTFFYTPLFNEPYWRKVVEVRKKVPLVQYELHRNAYENEHAYEMLLHEDWIPDWKEMNVYRDVDKNIIPFDYDFYKYKFKTFSKNNRARKIRCVQTGEVWSSVKQAAECLNICYNTLYSHVKLKKKNKGIKSYNYFHFQYVS